ncbi:MAG: U32 family peptidase [Clostridia bacterium]|nr:U32 family peptidase [Clostridia bacterium]
MTDKRPELLAPAGSPEALAAAIEGGADAVYFGATNFSARMRARNFDDTELADAVALCRAYGVKSYITVNTRVRDTEILPDGKKLSPIYETLYRLNEAGADALIVADLGVAAMIRECFPDMELHASTQLSGVSSEDAAALKALGFSRMVCPRELSIGQITSLCDRSPLEIEMFIHGAHCVSFSGQCMLSYAMGGRSGNRGECAQPCRLPYTVSGKDGVSLSQYPLSLKDMCLASHIREILLSGVTSLKIEGRQKSADYVWGVTKMYRKLLDERRDATKEEIEHLAGLFSRDGFTDGYAKQSFRGMLGIRREEDTENSKKAESFPGLTKKVPLAAHLTVNADTPVSLSVTVRGKTVTVAENGVIAAPAKSAPLTAELAEKNIGKLGGTPYVLESFTADIGDGLFLTTAQLNALRRAALRVLAGGHGGARLPANREISAYTPPAAPLLTAEFLSPAQIPAEAESFFDEISLPLHCRTKNYGVTLPEYAPDKRMGQLRAALSLAKPSSVIAHSPAQIRLAAEMGIPASASLRLNVFNSLCAEEILQMGCTAVTPSPELPLGAIRAIRQPKSVIVYGRIPLMLTLRCAISDGGAACAFHRAGGFAETDTVEKNHLCLAGLKDRTGVSFPLVGMYDCTNVLYNSVPIWMADKQKTLASLGAARYHFLFTTETRDEVAEILRAWRDGRSPADPSKIRRLK